MASMVWQGYAILAITKNPLLEFKSHSNHFWYCKLNYSVLVKSRSLENLQPLLYENSIIPNTTLNIGPYTHRKVRSSPSSRKLLVAAQKNHKQSKWRLVDPCPSGYIYKTVPCLRLREADVEWKWYVKARGSRNDRVCTGMLSPTWPPKHKLNSDNRHAKVDEEYPTRPQPHTKNYRQLKNA